MSLSYDNSLVCHSYDLLGSVLIPFGDFILSTCYLDKSPPNCQKKDKSPPSQCNYYSCGNAINFSMQLAGSN